MWTNWAIFVSFRWQIFLQEKPKFKLKFQRLAITEPVPFTGITNARGQQAAHRSWHCCNSVWPKMAKSTLILHKNDTSKVGKVYTDYFVNFQLLKSLRKDKPSPSRTSGAWESSSTSFLQDNFRSRATRPKRQSRTSSTSGSSSSGCTRRWRWRPPGCSCGSSSVHHGTNFTLETICKENLLDFYPFGVFTFRHYLKKFNECKL